ncbi:MAG: hypothetical protein WKG00_08025 [Polyangiaceae bacterium]
MFAQRLERLVTIVGMLALLCACKLFKGKDDADLDAGAAVRPPTPALPAAPATDVEFAGTFTKTAQFTIRNGQRFNSATGKGTGTVTVGNGKVVYALTYPGTDVATAVVTQTYSYGPGDVRPVAGGFDATLVFVKMDSNTKNFNADSTNPRLQARRSGGSWQIGLTTTDSNGVFGGVEFR